MALRRGNYPPRGAHGSRRNTGWGLGPGGSTVTSFSASSVAFLGGVITVGTDGFTITRLRGNLQAFLETGGVSEGYHCAIGVAVVTSDAIAVGITAVPDPVADAGWDGWLYHRFFDVHNISATLTDGANAMSAHVQFEVDSKAMRKMGDNDTLFASVEVIEAGTSALDIFFDSRLLMKLP